VQTYAYSPAALGRYFHEPPAAMLFESKTPAAVAVCGEFDRLDAMLSVWKDASDIVRLNAAAGDHAVPVND
jgi:thiamine biosynthesis lipoprotein ApbE